MNNIDITKPVKFKNPQPGEENLIYNVTNYNEVTMRCYIQPLNLSGFTGVIPQELVSVDDIENVVGQ